jgi:hypothetical protein
LVVVRVIGVVVLLGVYVQVKVDTTPGVTVKMLVPESPPLVIVPPCDPSLIVTVFPALQLPAVFVAVHVPGNPTYVVAAQETE